MDLGIEAEDRRLKESQKFLIMTHAPSAFGLPLQPSAFPLQPIHLRHYTGFGVAFNGRWLAGQGGL